jgi:hypothetical protein
MKNKAKGDNLAESTATTVGACTHSAEVPVSTQPDSQSTKSPITHTCEELCRGSVWNRQPCGNAARFLEKKWGKEQWFCGMHAPSEVQRRRNTRSESRRIAMAPVLEAEQKQWRLERAAHDLLEVAKMVDAASENGIGGVLLEADSPLVIAARQAIAKAEGR